MLSYSMQPSVCIVVPVRNRLELTKRFLNSIAASTYTNYTLVLIDDGSTDETVEFIRTNYPMIELIIGDGNLWWAGATNKGVEYALKNNYDYVLTINQDAEVAPDYLEKFVAYAQRFPNKLIGSVILEEDGIHLWSLFPTWDYFYQEIFHMNYAGQVWEEVKPTLSEPIKAQALNGDGTLIPVKVFREIGLYDASWFPQYHADSEICLRAARHGYECIICPDVTLINHGVTKNAIKSAWQRITDKRSHKYLPALFKLYFTYAPGLKKLGFFYQYLVHLKYVPGKILGNFTKWQS